MKILRPVWLATAAVAGALSLTAAGSPAAYQLGIPSFQTLKSRIQSTAQRVSVTWVDSHGEKLVCKGTVRPFTASRASLTAPTKAEQSAVTAPTHAHRMDMTERYRSRHRWPGGAPCA